jgi:hypothetical protein
MAIRTPTLQRKPNDRCDCADQRRGDTFGKALEIGINAPTALKENFACLTQQLRGRQTCLRM